MSRSTFLVPGEDVGVWAPVALGFGGFLGAVAAAAIFASSANPARASELVSTSVAMVPDTKVVSVARAPSPTDVASPSASGSAHPGSPACAPVRVAFQSNAVGPSPVARAEIDRLAAWLGAHPDVTLLVSGHADALGTEDGNLRLSHMRAESVARELSARGVDRARMTVRGYGAYQPVEGVPEDAADNRRVVVHVRGECPRGFEEVIGP